MTTIAYLLLVSLGSLALVGLMRLAEYLHETRTIRRSRRLRIARERIADRRLAKVVGQ